MMKHVIICVVFVTQFFCVQSADDGRQPIPFGAAFAVPVLVHIPSNERVVPEPRPFFVEYVPGSLTDVSRRVPEPARRRVKPRRLFPHDALDQVVPEASEASEVRLQTQAERDARAEAMRERRRARLNRVIF